MDYKNATETEFFSMSASRDELLAFTAGILSTLARDDFDFFQIYASSITDPDGNVGGSLGFGSIRREFSLYSELDVVVPSCGLPIDEEDLGLLIGAMRVAAGRHKAYEEKRDAVIAKLASMPRPAKTVTVSEVEVS